jgi:hypothetical protein
MPTEGQFEEAEVRFFNAADDAQELLRPTRRANERGALEGGRLTADVNGFVEAAGARMNAIAEGLRELGRECRKRAQECREAAAAQAAFSAATAAYDAASRRYAAQTSAYDLDPTLPQPGDPPTAPTAPPAPPTYVQV